MKHLIAPHQRPGQKRPGREWLDGFRNGLRLFGILVLSLPATKAVAEVTYGGSTYSTASETAIGHAGAGSLLVDAASSLSVSALRVGRYSGPGTVTVTGSGTTLTLSNELSIGQFGQGTLNLEMGATMTVSRSITLGSTGSASLNIRSGAVLTSTGVPTLPTISTTSIGSTSGTVSVLVDGAGSKWDNPSMGIGVGNASNNRTASFTISNGGAISTSSFAVNRGSTLVVTGRDALTQAAATLDLTGGIRIDSSATNSAVVSAGGVISARSNSFIGSYLNEEGTTTVTGADSQLNVVGDLTLGDSSGKGTLTVSDGAVVSVSKAGSALGTGDGKLTVGGMPTNSAPGTPSSVGVLRIGMGAAAGRLNVAEVYGWVYSNNLVPPADSTIIFNHNETGYQFTTAVNSGILISGGTKVQHLAGTTILTAASTYQGGTQINGGTLKVNNTTGSGTGTGAVTVSGTGTLGGSGRVTGNITVENGGATHPGNSKVFSGANLEYKTGSTAKFTLGAPVSLGESPIAGQDYDQIALTGNLKVGTGTTLEMQLTASTMAYFHDLDGTDPEANYFLFNLDSSSVLGQFDFLNVMLDGTTYTQSILDGRATFADLGITVDIGYTGNAATNSLLGGNDVTIQISAVPEPLTGCLLLVGGAGALFVRRRMSLLEV